MFWCGAASGWVGKGLCESNRLPQLFTPPVCLATHKRKHTHTRTLDSFCRESINKLTTQILSQFRINMHGFLEKSFNEVIVNLMIIHVMYQTIVKYNLDNFVLEHYISCTVSWF